MQKWYLPTDIARKVNEKNGVICLVSVYTPRVIVIKMSKMTNFLYFVLMAGINSHSLGKIYLSAHLIEFFQKTVWLIVFGVTVPEILRVEI